MKLFRIALITIMGIMLPTATAYDYTPTEDDVETLQSLISAVEEVIDGDLSTHYSFIRQIHTLNQSYTTGKIDFLLETLHGYLAKELTQQKSQTDEDLRSTYQAFVDAYADQVQSNHPLHTNCIAHIDELDTLAYIHNVSLPVLIGTRYRESTCGYYLPNNTRGPMQIISHNYGTGAITDHETFIYAMENYIDFANAKYDRYNRVTDSGESITLDYTTISYDDIIKHGALYNSLSGGTIYGDIAPTNPYYVFNNFGGEYAEGNRDGLLTVAIKTMQWWLENR